MHHDRGPAPSLGDPVASARWRRLDRPGEDACTLRKSPDGWVLAGRAIWRLDEGNAIMAYEVEADDGWRTKRGTVEGTAGTRAVRLDVERDGAGGWRVNGQPVPGLRGCDDLDLGFTPATNLLPLRRLGEAAGRVAADAAWLDEDAWAFRRLPQWYERRGPGAWWYESPAAGYAALLRVTPDGFVADYPGLWRLVP